ncbi:MAG TPA: FAD-dependent monooxygenase [Actinomycetes bacterium]|jgi:anthraniloyl-CoA monooxygenase|nr:FAD-dependent monooxygenase [Actinomycetes bacterium]
MKVGILGAGPAGLYLALLLKKLDPGHEVRVVERNPPGATFGWGVVFSEETLGALRDADYETHEQITDSFAKWGAIDVLYRGETVRSRGHVFSGMSRKVLLELLQRRCRELGSVLEFEREVADLEPFAGCDLVVAADGVFSTVRRRLERHFEPSLDPHRTKYAWFGSDLVFDAFTFVFRDTEHGLFQVHAYPFDARTSTFIVETHESTWRQAGLDQMSEQESLEYCQELFRPELGEHRLLSNRSIWFTFETLRNRSWHHGNVVLLGDAAHTAHFTIGSGTKLAMEDAISLANALQRFPGDLEAALTRYELERQPVVERFQEAARDSATYFESVSRYNRFEPVQFAFNLLTRSGRISHLELERRDARFVAAVDRWFAGAATGQHAPMLAPPPLFTPFTLGATTVGNRIVLSPGGEDVAVDGQPGEVHERAIAAAVRSGAGLVLTEEVAVSAEGRTTPGTPGLYRDEHATAWRSLLERARAEGPGLLGVRLAHAGRRGATQPRRRGVDRPLREEGWPLLAPSPLPYTPQHPAPQELTREGMEQVREAYRAAAGRAAEAGFDLLVLDMAHGYLLASFLSPLTNRRQDGYGGPLEQRLRFPLEVLDAVRAAWPSERPLAVRLQASDRAPGGLDIDDAVAVAGRLRGHGCDLVEVAAGWTVPWDRPDYRWLYLVPASDRVRNEAGVPTVAAGNLTTADEVNTILAAGRADLCLLDPRLHAAAG